MNAATELHNSRLGSGCGIVGKSTRPKWSKMVSKSPYSELDFSIRETKMDQNGPFWPKEVYFCPFRSANRTLAIRERYPRHLVEISNFPYFDTEYDRAKGSHHTMEMSPPSPGSLEFLRFHAY